ncbi:microtubule-actin cross-linking factor 1-like [Arapaima gigas]
MGKPLSKPDCLRRGPRCLGKGDGEDGGIEDCYIPQRSIYDTVRINEQIDQGSASSTLGSGAGEGSTLSTNGTLAASVASRPGSGKKLDERQIFDALKLSVDPQSRPPGEGGASISPGASSCSSGLGVARRPGSTERNDSNRRSWKTFLPPEFVEETTENQEPMATTSQAPPPAGSSSIISPQSSSPHVPPSSRSSPQTSNVTTLTPLRPNVLSTPVLVSSTNQQPSLRLDPTLFAPTRLEKEGGAEEGMVTARSSSQGPHVCCKVAMGADLQPESPVQELDSDTAPLLPALAPPPPALCATPTERTWPRRLMGRRRTVSQGGVLHNLPVLPPLPPLLANYSSMNEESVRLLGRPPQAGELHGGEKDWRVLQQLEEEEEEGSETADESGWEAVLRQVDSLWEPLLGGVDLSGWDPQHTGSLGRWPLLRPPAGFGGSEPPSGPGSELGSDDLELEAVSEEPGGTEGLTDSLQPLGVGPPPLDHCQLPETPKDSELRPSEKGDKEEQQPTASNGDRQQSAANRDSSAGSTGGTESPQKDSRTEETAPGRSDMRKDVSMETQDAGNEPPHQMGDAEGAKEKVADDGGEKEEEQLKRSTSYPEVTSEPRRAELGEPGVDGADLPLPLSPSKHEARSLGVEGKEADAFVATDSFIYLAVSALPPLPQETKAPSLEGSEPPSPGALPQPWPEENDFLSTDSFVYLAAPERLPLSTAGSCTCGDSQASSSEDSRSGVDFVLGSMTGDSDWDSDGSGSEPMANQPAWDHWEELEPAVLPDLFCDDTVQSELPDHEASGGSQEVELGSKEVELGSQEVELGSGAEAEVGLSPMVQEADLGLVLEAELGVLMGLFNETLAQLNCWFEETETLMEQLPPVDINPEALRKQQDHFRILRDGVSEHQACVRKLQLIGAALVELSSQEGATVRQQCSSVEKRYLAIREKVSSHGAVLEEAVFQSSQFHEKMGSLLETLERAAQRLRQRPPVAVEVEKIQEQLAVHRAAGWELDKLLPSYSAICVQGKELVMCEQYVQQTGQAVQEQLLWLQAVWDEIRQRADEREAKLLKALSLAEAFWAEADLLWDTLGDARHAVDTLEAPGVDPLLIKHQMEVAEALRKHVDGLWQRLGALRSVGEELVATCGETDKQHVVIKVEEISKAWDVLSRTCGDRKDKLEEALMSSLQYQHALQNMFGYLDRAVRELSDMSCVAVDLGTVTQQMEELKLYKAGVYQQQVAMESLSHKGAMLLQQASDPADRNKIQEPLSVLRDLWDHLGSKIVQRQHQLEGALLALGQLPYALSELQSWLSQSHAFLNTQQPISWDPKTLEMELANNHVLKNELLSRSSTLERFSAAGWELIGATMGNEGQHLQEQLDMLSHTWENLLVKIQAQQNLLETSLQKAECFHAELEEILKWLTLTESRLDEAQSTGGLPEMAREHLQRHMVLQEQLLQRVDQYHRLLDQVETFQVAHGEEDEAGLRAVQTLQKLTVLQDKWNMISTKMEEKKVKLEQVAALATSFQASLQMCINWLIQAEQALNMAPPPSLILDTVLLQIDQHQEFMTGLNSHRDLVEALENVGSQLSSISLEQDVVLVRSLLLRVHSRWDQLVQSSLERDQRLEKACTTAEQFKGVWLDLWEWLQEADGRLDVDVESSNDPEKINSLLAEHKEFQKVLCSKRPVFYTTVRFCRTIRERATLPADTLKLGNLLGKIRDKWDCVSGKSVDRQQLLEESLLRVGQVGGALQGVVDWLLQVELQLGEEHPVHGDLGLVAHLVDSHKVLQQELSKRAISVQALKRSAAELTDRGWRPSVWEEIQVEELSQRWERVCLLSVNRQLRLQQALKQAEEFRSAVQRVRAWLSGAEQSLRFRGVLPEELEPLQALLHTHRELMEALQEKRPDVDRAVSMGEDILPACHPDGITPIRQAVAALEARYQEVLTWTKLHQQRLERALLELQDSLVQLEDLQSWLLWADTILAQREAEPVPQDVPQLRALVVDHQFPNPAAHTAEERGSEKW